MADFRLGRLKFNWRGNWQSSTAYVIDDIVKFGANTYVCTTNHTSSASEQVWYSVDQSNWSLHVEGIRNVGTFTPGTFYKINDIVLSGNTQYRVTAGIGTTAVGVSTSNSVQYLSGFNGEGAYDAGVVYQSGDVVSFNGSSYVAISTSTVGVLPVNQLGTVWNFLSEGIQSSGINTYQPGANYYKGDLVKLGGDIYRHVATSSINVNPAIGSTVGVGSTVVGVAVTAWESFNSGLRYAGTYSTTTDYYLHDVVEYSSSAYVGIGSTSFRNITPGTNAATWAALALGDSNALLTTKGDILIRNASAPARLAIGNTGYTLGVSTSGIPEWTIVGDATRVYYVDPEKGSDTYSGSTPDLACKTLQYACNNASAVTNITNFIYDRVSGISTITAPAHGILYSNVRIRLDNVTFECLSGGRSYNVNGFTYDKTSGIGTVNVGAGATGITVGTIVRLKGLEFTCPGSSGITTTIFPDGTRAQNSNYTVTSVNSATSFAINVGVSTINHLYVQGGNAFVGVDTTIFPRSLVTSYFDVLNIPDPNTITVNVGVSTIEHTYLSGGKVISLSPAVIKLSASEFAEQLPITVPPFTSIVGSTLRSSKVRPAAGLSTDGVTPNNRQTMFRLSDATTIQGLNVSGLVGFNYDLTLPLVLDNTTVKTGVGSTACGIYFAFNPTSPISTKSPYVKDCTSFGDPSTDGYGGAGVGAFIDGGLHNSGSKTMVFDAYTNVLSDGAGFILDKDAGAEIVSCFTYYARWGYYAGGGSRIRSVGGNNSYGSYGVIASGFSTAEPLRTVRVFGDRMTTVVGSKTGTVSVGNTMIGETSGARATFINDQTSADRIYYKYYPGYGAVGVGTTAFKDGEQITFIGAGTTGAITVSAVVGSVSGQKGVIIEVDEVNPNNLPLVGDAIGFNTTGIGSDRVNNNIRYYIINNVTGFTTSYVQSRGYGNTGLSSVTYNNRITLTISPEKSAASPDTRSTYLSGVGTASGGSFAEIRTKFSNARLTGHDFLSIGVGNKVTTNYPNVPESTVNQSRETSNYGPGKVFFVSTDQGGNFRVGNYFSVDQLTGRATLDASAFNLSGLTELRLGSLGGQIGEAINEFSSDETMSGNSNQACPTEFATAGYITRGKMGTGAMVPSKGTTAQRPASLIEGQFRYNTDTKTPEFYDGTSWRTTGTWINATITTTTTAVAWRQYFCNTSGGGFTLTLPASPYTGDAIRIFDLASTFNTNNLTIGRNALKIQGDSADMTVATQGASFELVYSGATYGWRITSV